VCPQDICESNGIFGTWYYATSIHHSYDNSWSHKFLIITIWLIAFLQLFLFFRGLLTRKKSSQKMVKRKNSRKKWKLFRSPSVCCFWCIALTQWLSLFLIFYVQATTLPCYGLANSFMNNSKMFATSSEKKIICIISRCIVARDGSFFKKFKNNYNVLKKSLKTKIKF
jgi:ABC-type Fe3+ transport system permease subunit